MPATRKYQTIVINNKTRFCCPDCDKTFKTDVSASGHWCKFHKTADTATDNNNKNKPTIVIPDTQPLRSAKSTMVTRKEFDELNVKYDTIIEMLKNMTTTTITTETTTSKPVVETCEISTQTDDVIVIPTQLPVEFEERDIEKLAKDLTNQQIENALDRSKCQLEDAKRNVEKKKARLQEPFDKYHELRACVQHYYGDMESLQMYEHKYNEIVKCKELKEKVEEPIKVEEPVYDITHEQPCEQVVELVEVEKQVEVEEPKKQLKTKKQTKAAKPPKKSAEEMYNEIMNDLRSHPYFSHTTEDGIDMFKFGKSLYNELHHVIQAYERYCNNVKSGALWAGGVLSQKITQQELDEKRKEAQKNIHAHEEIHNKFVEAWRRLQNIKGGKPKKKQTPKKAKQVEQVEVEQPQEETIEEEEEIIEEQEETVEQPIEKPTQEVSKASDNEEFRKQSKEFLLDCCRTLFDGGFARAYHHLNDNANWHIMEVKIIKKWKDNVKRPIIKKDKDGKDMKDQFGGYVYVTTGKGEKEKLKYETVTETFTEEKIDYKVLVKPNAKSEKDKYAKVGFSVIREHMESIYKKLFATWTEYRLSKGDDFDEEDVFDDDPKKDTWLNINHKLVNDDNLKDFFWTNNSQ